MYKTNYKKYNYFQVIQNYTIIHILANVTLLCVLTYYILFSNVHSNTVQYIIIWINKKTYGRMRYSPTKCPPIRPKQAIPPVGFAPWSSCKMQKPSF